MAELIDLKTYTDQRGNLTVIEKVIPFDIKRIFYIYGVDDSVIIKLYRQPFVFKDIVLYQIRQRVNMRNLFWTPHISA